MSATLNVGDVVAVNHTRKGRFVGTITRLDDELATILLREGERANAMLHDNVVEGGEEVTIRRSFATFTVIPDANETEAA